MLLSLNLRRERETALNMITVRLTATLRMEVELSNANEIRFRTRRRDSLLLIENMDHIHQTNSNNQNDVRSMLNERMKNKLVLTLSLSVRIVMSDR